MKNLGNFSNRCLKFLSSSFGGVVPEYEGALVEQDSAFFKSLLEKFNEFVDLLTKIGIIQWRDRDEKYRFADIYISGFKMKYQGAK